MTRSSIVALVFFALSLPGVALADPPQTPGEHDGYRCPAGLDSRTPEEVFADRIAAMAVGDIDRVMCDYADDAVVMTPEGIGLGKDQIRAGLEAMFGMLGGTLPTLNSLTAYGEVVYVTFSVTGPFFSIPDGADAYVIRHGRIQYHVVHNTLVFNLP